MQAALQKSGLPFGAKAAGGWVGGCWHARVGVAGSAKLIDWAVAAAEFGSLSGPSSAPPPLPADPNHPPSYTPGAFQQTTRLPTHPRSPAEPMSLDAYAFKHEPRDYKAFWDVRRGLIPIVGAARKPGTSMLLEDVACPVDK